MRRGSIGSFFHLQRILTDSVRFFCGTFSLRALNRALSRDGHIAENRNPFRKEAVGAEHACKHLPSSQGRNDKQRSGCGRDIHGNSLL